MIVNTNSLISINEANENFSKVTRIVDKNGSAVILKNNVPRYVIMDISEIDKPETADDADVLETDEADEEANARGNREFERLRDVTDDPSAERSDGNDEEENAVDHDEAHSLGEVPAHAEHDVEGDERVEAEPRGKADRKFAVESHEDRGDRSGDGGSGEDARADLFDGCPVVPIEQDIGDLLNLFDVRLPKSQSAAGPVAGKHAGERICEEYDAQEHNRIERGIVKLYLVQKPYRCIPDTDSHCSSDYEL